MRYAAPAFLIGLGLAGAALAAEPDTYIFDVLALQPYKGNFARLVKGADVPDWVKAISVQGEGAAGPSRTVAVAGTPYRIDRVCKVGVACATDRIDVLWGPRGARVWAALVEDGRAPLMLGDPRGAQAEALRAAADPVAASVPAASAPAGSAPAGSVAAAEPAPASPAPAPVAPPPAEADPYIFDVLPLQPYKGNFARLVKGRDVPDWVKAISAQGAGSAGPARTVAVAGAPYRLDRVCKVGGACASDRIDVLWGPRGTRVWAALVEDGRAPVMLGEPKEAQARALANADGGAPPPAATPKASVAPSPTATVASAQPAAPASAPAGPATPAAAAGSDADPYIFDVLAVQPYKGNFARLARAKGVPGWVKAIAAQGAGSAGPMRTVEVAGTPYRLDRVCRVGASCATDRIDVLWGPRGARVWAALVEGGGAPVLLGDPKGPQAAALAGAASAPPRASN